MAREEFQALARDAVEDRDGIDTTEAARLTRFLDRVDYVAVDAVSDEGWDDLAARLNDGGDRIRVFTWRWARTCSTTSAAYRVP